ncbi:MULTISPECIES: lipopolysaccharide biosynthesis protein [Vibrio]|uniref:lipopolysaccharide biosynthesis protein n=1 Tax=Vibrio TaxID=662 RepID=UPI00142E955E|nr:MULTISPECIES: oligosaccharide flippase family protein [Vibrio]
MKTSGPLASIATYGVGLVLNKGLSLLMLPLMASYLMPEQIGKLDLLATIGAVTGIVLALAMHEVIYRFASVKTDDKQQFKCASEIYTTTSCISLAFAATLFFMINLVEIPATSPVSKTELNLLLLCASLEGVLGISNAWLRLKDRAKTFLAVSVCSTAIQVGLIVVVLINAPSVKAILACGAVTYLLQFVALHLINRFKWRLPSKTDVKPYLYYSAPLMLAALVSFGLNGSERLFLAYSSDFATLGWYSVAAKFSLAMCILMQPFGMWWMPKRFQALEQQGVRKCAQVTQLGIVYLTMLTIAVAFAAKAFITLTLPSEYLISTQLLVGTLLVAWFKEISELLNIGILYKKRTKGQLQICLAATIVGLVLMWQLQSHGIWGIIIALGIAQMIKAIITFVVSQTLVLLPYQYLLLLSNFIVLMCSLYLSYYTSNPWLCIAFACLVPLIALLPVALSREFSPLFIKNFKGLSHRVRLGLGRI